MSVPADEIKAALAIVREAGMLNEPSTQLERVTIALINAGHLNNALNNVASSNMDEKFLDVPRQVVNFARYICEELNK